jgi:hypothetical protein
VNRLNVLRKGSNNESLIWTKKGNQVNVWLNGQVDLYSNELSTIVFEEEVGFSFYVRPPNLKI